MKEFCDIPINPKDGPGMIAAASADREMFAESHAVIPTGHVSLPANAFPAMLAVMQQIVQGTVWDKKARVVLEYDPQAKKAEIDVFMESPAKDHPGDRESP